MHPLFGVVFLLARVAFFYLEALMRVFVPVKDKDIRGQNVLITGGGRGIGRAMAIRFSQQGANIAIWDMDQDCLTDTASDLKIRGVKVYTDVVDVTKPDTVTKAAAKLREEFGDIDILCNNAGILVGKSIMDLTEQDIRRTYEVNSIAHFWTVKEFLPSMMRKKYGHIVTTASMAAKTGSPLLVDYCASKFAAYGFTEALRAEIYVTDRHAEVHTTTVCPMFVNTNLIFGDEVKQRISRNDRFGKLLEPDDVAKATVEGVLKNKLHVYVPPDMSRVNIANAIIPTKALQAINEFLDIRFIPAK